MSEFLEIMLRPFVACLVLTGIHSYLGLHVLRRGIIFVDLALAQTAAFGATVGFALGLGLHSNGNYFCALGFTLLGALLLTFTRHKESIVPQEAYIGIVYVVCAAASIVVLSQAPEGGEELKSLLVGHLLFAEWHEILKIALLYSLVALLHFRFRKEFWSISNSFESAKADGLPIRLLDFLFYASFGVVVTSSTEMAGVLLVFAFLVVPAACATLISQTLSARMLTGWVCGALTSIAGIALSYYLDLPTGAAVVCMFGIALLTCISIRAISKNYAG